ncbi:MAG: EutN/CcmL family microcompartment protein [Deltaproteobacteria bacterium]|nr:EutN/CcmL family microcompartment protein [Deltaproteobacteria bacterium]
MFVGRVVGQVWSTVKWEPLRGLRLLLVRPHRLGDLRRLSALPAAAPPRDDEGVVVADVLGAGNGEDVVVAYGHAARVGIEELKSATALPSYPIDAAVVAIVDRLAVSEVDAGAVDHTAQHS